MTALYTHPDGHSIDFTDGILTATNADGESASVPIGPYGLLVLADALGAVVDGVRTEGGMPEANINSRNDESPTRDQASGDSNEQSELFDLPAFCPILPPVHSAAAQALDDLLRGDLTQLDWLQSGNGWRLAAAVKELDYLGWEPKSIRVKCNGWGRKIARYSLHAKAKQAAYAMRHGGDNA